jgi:chitinase
VTFAPGQTSATIHVAVLGDILYEEDETFGVVLSSPTGASLGRATGIGTILNDDVMPTVSINDVSIVKLSSGYNRVSFTVTISAPSALPVTVTYSTADGTATTAAYDYYRMTNLVTIPPGQTSATTNGVIIYGNTRTGPNKTFTMRLSSVDGATVAKGSGTCTIINGS